MPSWWPLSGKADNGTVGHSNGTVPMIGSSSDMESFRRVNDGTWDDSKENMRGIGAHQTDGLLSKRKTLDKGDIRASVMDTDSVDALLERFSTEFKQADAHMKDRAQRKKPFQLYDYDGDARFQQWKKDQEGVRETLKIHWIDTMIDRPTSGVVYLLRLFTTAGLFYGMGRTAYLYRTMDKVYAKLNGVSLGRIAFNEITSSVAKGGGLALAAAAGLVAGDTVATLVTLAVTGDIARPERHWGNVAASGAMAGFFTGATFALMHASLLSPWGMKMATLGFTAVGGAAGLILGYCVYRPFAATREHALYDPYWRPWHMRVRRDEGPSLIRGKFV